MNDLIKIDKSILPTYIFPEFKGPYPRFSHNILYISESECIRERNHGSVMQGTLKSPSEEEIKLFYLYKKLNNL